MRRLLLLANPAASGFTGAAFREVRTALAEDWEVAAEWPDDAVDARRRAAAAAAGGVDAVAAMGGDGIVHHVANGLVGTDTALAIVPAGTTNVLARILGLPSRPAAAARRLARLPATPTPMLRVEAVGVDGERRIEYATFAAGVGYDADVVAAAERRPHAKLRLGGVHYATTAISKLLLDWRGRVPNLSVSCDGERVDALALLTQVYGPYTYFGKVALYLTPERHAGFASLAAGDLEVHRSAELFLRAILRRPVPERLGTRIWKDFAEIAIEAEPPAPYEADGEHLGMAVELRLSPVPEAIRILRDPVIPRGGGSRFGRGRGSRFLRRRTAS